jgi:hypothetical protein
MPTLAASASLPAKANARSSYWLGIRCDNPTRALLAVPHGLADATDARKWRDWIKEEDPKDEGRSLRLAVLAKCHTSTVADLYIAFCLGRGAVKSSQRIKRVYRPMEAVQ